MSELTEDVLRFLDGETSPEEEADLARRIRGNSEAEAELAFLMSVNGALSTVLANRSQAVNDGQGEAPVSVIPNPERPLSRRARTTRRASLRAQPWYAGAAGRLSIAAGLLLVVGALVFKGNQPGRPSPSLGEGSVTPVRKQREAAQHHPNSPRPSLIVRSVATAGATRTTGRANTSRPIKEGDRVFAGDEITVTKGSPIHLGTDNDSLKLVLHQGRLELTRMSEPGESHLNLDSGVLSAEVASREQDLIIQTPEATSRILGTRFSLNASEVGTRLEVTEGTVRIESRSSKDAATVKAGFFAEFLASAKAEGTKTFRFQDGLSPSPAYRGTRDTVLSESEPDATAGGRVRLSVDGEDPKDSGLHSVILLAWDLTQIAPGSRVLAAHLEFMVRDQLKEGLEADGFDVHAMRTAWKEEEATWKRASRRREWHQPGANAHGIDHNPNSLGKLAARLRGPTKVTLNQPGIEEVQSWIDQPEANHGLLIKGDLTDGIDVFSRELPQNRIAERPCLVVTVSSLRTGRLKE